MMRYKWLICSSRRLCVYIEFPTVLPLTAIPNFRNTSGLHCGGISTQCLISLQPVTLRQIDKLKWKIVPLEISCVASPTIDRSSGTFAFPQEKFAYNSAVNRSTKLSHTANSIRSSTDSESQRKEHRCK